MAGKLDTPGLIKLRAPSIKFGNIFKELRTICAGIPNRFGQIPNRIPRNPDDLDRGPRNLSGPACYRGHQRH
jgi:hypothetical protein